MFFRRKGRQNSISFQLRLKIEKNNQTKDYYYRIHKRIYTLYPIKKESFHSWPGTKKQDTQKNALPYIMMYYLISS